jgi:hypothetical protein
MAASAALFAFAIMAASSPGAHITSSVQQAAGTNWNAPAIWSNNAAPSAGNTYELLPGGNPTRLRNPEGGGTHTFGGDSLTVNAQTEIRTKGTGTATVVNFPGVGGNPGLILNGGTINTGDNVVFGLSGNILVSTTSTFDFGDGTGGTIAAARAVNITAPLSGTGTLNLRTAGTTNPLNIQSENNSFSGGWDVVTGFLKGTGVNSLGTGNISIAPGANGGARFDTDYPVNLPGASLTLAPANGANNAVMLLDQADTFGSVTINGTPLAPGTYSASQLLAQFPSNFDPASTGSLTVIPEPTSLALMGVVAALALRRRARNG